MLRVVHVRDAAATLARLLAAQGSQWELGWSLGNKDEARSTWQGAPSWRGGLDARMEVARLATGCVLLPTIVHIFDVFMFVYNVYNVPAEQNNTTRTLLHTRSLF